MVQFSENIKNAIKKLADKKHAECELVPYQMDINKNGFIQDIPSDLKPYRLASKQAQALLRLINVRLC